MRFATHGCRYFWKKRIFAVFFALFFLLAPLTLASSAATPEEILSNFLDALPELARDAIGDAAEDGRAAELVGVEHLFSLVLGAFSDAFSDSRPFTLTLAGAVLLFSALPLLFGEASGKLLKLLSGGMAAGLLLVLYPLVSSDMALVSDAISDMCLLSDALIPAFSGIFLAGGSPTTALASSAGFVGFSLLLENGAAGLFLPLLRILFAFTLISALGGITRTEGIFRTLRQIYITALVFLSLLLTASLAFQTALTASADGLSVRSVKFALGQMIPIIGGSLSETLRTLTASLSFLKSSIGAFSVVSLLAMVIPPLVRIFLHRIAFSLAASVASMLGGTHVEKLCNDLRGLYDLALATLAIFTVLFLLILTLLARLGVALAI